VLDVEADLSDRLAARSAPARADQRREHEPELPAAVRGQLDAGQAAAVTALAGDRPLIVVEGAAGAGKTTTLAATRALLHARGSGLVVVTPTLKAAKVAAAEVGTATGSAAWLTFQHGWRWTDDGVWTGWPPATPTRAPEPSTPARSQGRASAPGICSWSTRPACSTRTPPAPC
jgi:ATP-dependent exoDNAse (exonuclease V) alpha subunit